MLGYKEKRQPRRDGGEGAGWFFRCPSTGNGRYGTEKCGGCLREGYGEVLRGEESVAAEDSVVWGRMFNEHCHSEAQPPCDESSGRVLLFEPTLQAGGVEGGFGHFGKHIKMYPNRHLLLQGGQSSIPTIATGVTQWAAGGRHRSPLQT